MAFILLVLLFLGITLLKKQDATEVSGPEITSYSSQGKERIKAFWAHYYLATDHRIAGDWEQAAIAYEKALEINDQHEDALYYLGNMYLELNRSEDAKENWTRLVELNPQSARGHFQLGNLYLSDPLFNIQLAEKEFNRSMEINKEETGALLRLGQVYLLKGQVEEAQSYFNAVIGSNFKSIEAHILAGYLAWKREDEQKAKEMFRNAWKYAKDDLSPKEVLGEGDTKGGKSFERPIARDLFHAFIQPLPKISEERLFQEMNNIYQDLDKYLIEMKRKIN